MKSESTADKMRCKLTAGFAPILLEIVDDSAKHAGHAGSRPGGETHFTVRMTSTAFDGQSKVARHRAVYAALADEMREGGIHALALELMTAEEAKKA